MNDNTHPTSESQTAVDDVRRVRESIAKQHAGDFRAHMEETNRIFEEFREKLKITLVEPTPEHTKRAR